MPLIPIQVHKISPESRSPISLSLMNPKEMRQQLVWSEIRRFRSKTHLQRFERAPIKKRRSSAKNDAFLPTKN